MTSLPSVKIITTDAPKLLGPLNNRELNEALLYFATALDEVIDAVFLAHYDPTFLTPIYVEDLRLLQSVAQMVAETATLQTASDVCLYRR